MKKAIIVFVLTLLSAIVLAQTEPPKNLLVQDDIKFYWGESSEDFVAANGPAQTAIGTTLVYFATYNGRPRTTMFIFNESGLYLRSFLISPEEYQAEFVKVKVIYPDIELRNGSLCAAGLNDQQIAFQLNEDGFIRVVQAYGI